MDVSIYIEGKRLDLFKDEKIEINLQVKTVQDIDKIFADFTQSFNVPATPTNNAVFQYWYDNDVDGTFNANLRVDAHIEINSLPFRFGNIQLNDVKLSNLRPESYSIAFFSAAVNLSDLFKDDELIDLGSFPSQDHVYDAGVLNYLYGSPDAREDLYYPLISAIGDLNINIAAHQRDLTKSNNEITWREFKPALRLYRIIEKIETKYNVTFSRDFFDRAIFFNLFLWLQRESGLLKPFGTTTTVDITGINTINPNVSVDTVTDEVLYNRYVSYDPYAYRRYSITITPTAGYTNVNYTVILENNGVEVYRQSGVGTKEFVYGGLETGNKIKAKVAAEEVFGFTKAITVSVRSIFSGEFIPGGEFYTITSAGSQSVSAFVKVNEQMPKIKVKDFFTSLMQMFNLVITPNSATDFYIDTLDNWYSKGRLFDITPYVDIKTVTVKRPDVKKLIEFKYQKAGAILGEKYLTSNTVGYGDLKATYTIQGSDLKIESKFENLMFERLTDEGTGVPTFLNAGYSIDKNLQPYNAAPYIFYRHGAVKAPTPHIHIQPSTFSRLFHTATDNNVIAEQVTSSLNFGDDNSTYHYTPVEQGLYYNFWQTYIEDLYDGKTRVLSVSAERLPASIIYGLKLNDKLQFGDRRYKISAAKIDLTTGSATFDLFTDLDAPLDSVADTIALTVDTTNYTVDTTFLTADITQIQTPLLSFVNNEIDITEYNATFAFEVIDIRVSANTLWNVVRVDTGDGFFANVSKASGNKSDYVQIRINENTTANNRSMEFLFTIGNVSQTLIINQGAY
jgi:hypothetical protein